MTDVRTNLMNLQSAIGGGAKFSGSHMTAASGKIYMAFQGGVAPGLIEIDVSGR